MAELTEGDVQELVGLAVSAGQYEQHRLVRQVLGLHFVCQVVGRLRIVDGFELGVEGQHHRPGRQVHPTARVLKVIEIHV